MPKRVIRTCLSIIVSLRPTVFWSSSAPTDIVIDAIVIFGPLHIPIEGVLRSVSGGNGRRWLIVDDDLSARSAAMADRGRGKVMSALLQPLA